MSNIYLFQQRGAILLLMLIMLLMTVTTVVLSALNDRHDYRINQQQQTQRVLIQAKQALIGFAAGYDQTHDNTNPFIGYLPCPDMTGDGSANPPCANAGQTVLGRLPWRTLGLPLLTDGSGECLWYAVSGNFKDNPKQLITSDTDGDIIIKDANGNILHGNSALSRAIAVIFAPNQVVSGQTRGGGNGVGNKNECGYRNNKNADVNQVSNYLETLGGINNATGGGILTSYGSSDRLYRDDDGDDNNYPTFVQAGPAYNADDNIIFNDVLAVISPDDFAPVYKLMDYRAVSQSIQCIEQYFSDNRTNFFNTYQKPIGNWDMPADDTYRKYFASEIDLYVEEEVANCKYSKCRENCDIQCTEQLDECILQCNGDLPCETQCATDKTQCETDCVTTRDTCETNCELSRNNYQQNAIHMAENYPWASGLDSPDFKEQSGQRFGRIPSVLLSDTTTNILTVSNSLNTDMADSWSNECFNENDWDWWQVWKDNIFYAVDDNYAPQADSLIWVKTARSSNEVGTGLDKTWELEAWSDYVSRSDARIVTTLAKLTDSSIESGWELTTAPTPATPTHLRLSNSSQPFIVIAAGRRLDLNQNSTIAGYEPFTQIRDINHFCTFYPSLCTTCTTNPYASSCYKSRIDNYLEGDTHASLRLRNVSSNAMIGGNIPIDYNMQAVATIPNGDVDFIQESLDIHFFTDYACHSGWSCKKFYKE